MLSVKLQANNVSNLHVSILITETCLHNEQQANLDVCYFLHIIKVSSVVATVISTVCISKALHFPKLYDFVLTVTSIAW